MATMTIRCDAKLKEEASEVAKYYGFDLSSVTRALWMQMVRNHSIPLFFENDEPNEETIEAFEESSQMLDGGITYKSYTNARDLLDAARR